MRRVFFVVHLWLGLTLGLIAVVIGLSGSLMVFRPEIDDALAPHLHHATGEAYVPLQKMLDSARAAAKGATIGTIDLPREEGETVAFWTKKGDVHVYVDPATGQVLGQQHQDATPMGWLFKLHTELLGGESGHTFAGIVGIGLFLLCITGVVVWWPRAKQKVRDHLTVKWRAGTKRATYDLHRAWGFYISGLLGLVALMGVGLVFPDSYKAVAERLTGTKASAKPKAKGDAGCVALPLDVSISAVERALPQGRLTRVILPAKPGAPLTVRKRLPNEIHPNGMSFAYVDPCTAQVLRVERDEESSPAQRAMNLRYPLHVGRWGGVLSRCLQVLIGLSPLLLAVTGLTMWRRRVRRKAVVPR